MDRRPNNAARGIPKRRSAVVQVRVWFALGGSLPQQCVRQIRFYHATHHHLRHNLPNNIYPMIHLVQSPACNLDRSGISQQHRSTCGSSQRSLTSRLDKMAKMTNVTLAKQFKRCELFPEAYCSPCRATVVQRASLRL